jgi:hypothetical protein
MVATVHTSREISVEEVQRTLSDLLGADYQVTVTSQSTLEVQHLVMTTTVRVAHSDTGADLRVSGRGRIVLRALNALTITPKVKQALESIFPEQAELRKAYRWG